jgi:hypothetical protein
MEQFWSIDDLLDAHEAIEVRQELDMAAAQPTPKR